MAFIETAKFPGVIATDADLLNVLNNATGALLNAITSVATSIVLQSSQGAAFPAANFAITIQAEGANTTEIVLIASRSGDTLTVATSGRGFDGTAASAHSAGAVVELRVTAKTHNKAVAEIGAIETTIQSLANPSSEGYLRRTGANAYTQHQTNLNASADPTASNDSTQGYSVGSIWVNTTASPRRAFICVDNTATAAVWVQLGGKVQQKAVTSSLDNLAGFSPTIITSAWPLAKLALFAPITLYDTVTVQRILVQIGGTSSGNLDVGIYDESGNKKVSAGTTAMGAANAVQSISLTATVLAPGRYYLAIAVDNVTAVLYNASSVFNRQAGVKEQTLAALPLPTTASYSENATRQYIPEVSVTLET
jgi:hypothetical protein